MANNLTSLGLQNRFAFYSAFFRIFICFHLLKDLYFTWDYIPLLYGNKSFLESGPVFTVELLGINTDIIRNNINFFIGGYILLILFYAMGIGKYFTAVLLFLVYDTLQRLCPIILNGGDNLLKFCILYMIFIDSYQYFAVKKTRPPGTEPSVRIFLSNIAAYSICIHLCLVYLISGLHKAHADVWFNGVATYYTLSIERFQGTPINEAWARNGFFVTVSTYATIFIEMAYPTLIWFRQTKYYVMIAAILMHINIYVLMMIYDFQIIFIVLQGFFIPNEMWVKWYSKIKSFFAQKFAKVRFGSKIKTV